MLGANEATCVSNQQLNPAVIGPVDTMIEDLQTGEVEGKNVKVPEAELQQQQPEAGTDDLQQAGEVLKEKQEQRLERKVGQLVIEKEFLEKKCEELGIDLSEKP